MRKWREQAVHGRLRLAIMLMAAFVMFGALGGAVSASAAVPTLTVQPSKAQVNVGEEFDVAVYQDTDFPTLGAQGTLYFDAGLLQIVSVTPGDAYADAQLLLGVAPNVDDAAITEANTTGVLIDFGTYLFPGSSNVPAGHHLFMTIRMKASKGGTSALRLDAYQHSGCNPVSGTCGDFSDPPGFVPDPPDEHGTLLTAQVVNSNVTIGGGGGATSAASGSATPRPTVSRGTSVTPTAAGLVATPAGIKLTIDPASAKVDPGQTFDVSLAVEAPSAIKSAQVDLSFDKEVVSIEKITPGEAWKAPSAGYDSSISAANSSGKLTNLIVQSKSGSSAVPAGNVTLFKITFKGLKDGSSDLKIDKSVLVDSEGNELQGKADANGKLTIGSGGGSSSLPMILGAIVAVGIVGGAGAFVWNRRRKRWTEL
jgi:hypothetical protein